MASQQPMALPSTSKNAPTAAGASTSFQVSACFGVFLALLGGFLACADRWFPMPVATEEFAIIVILLLLPLAFSFHCGQKTALDTKLAALEEEDQEDEAAEAISSADVLGESRASSLDDAVTARRHAVKFPVPRIATASLDGTVRLWEPSTGQFQQKLEVDGHDGALNAMALSADGSIVATAACDGTARLWDAETGACIQVFDDGGGVVCCVAISPCGGLLLTGLDDNCAQLWRMPGGTAEASDRPLFLLEGHSSSVTSVAFSPCGTLAATGSLDGTARIWNLASGACEHVLEGHSAEVLTVAFSPHGDVLATGSRDGTACLWSVHAGWHLSSLDSHDTAVRAVAFSPCGQFVTTGCWDGSLRLWDVDNAQCQKTFPSALGSGPVHSIAYSADGFTLATVDRCAAKLWNVPSGACFKQLEGHSNTVQSVAFAF